MRRRAPITADTNGSSSRRTADRIEFAATVVMAVAAIMTAWAAFQSTKWSGVQADNYARASTSRTESVRETTIASRQANIDVGTFLQWLQAYRDDAEAGVLGTEGGGTYEADPGTLSGFIALRFRDEFRPAFDAWIASRPLTNSEAAPTPFQLPAYVLAAEQESNILASEADARTAEAREANQRGDNYVLLTVLFAGALFFAGVSGRLDRVVNSSIALGMAVTIVLVAAALMATYPVEL